MAYESPPIVFTKQGAFLGLAAYIVLAAIVAAVFV
tara:strand:+ start:30777 stop:30881 length:105 start_codon:yes stop_codon:yes gene_type:complete